MRVLLALLIALVAAPAVWGQTGSVRVTVRRANVRAEPSEKGPILTQATSGSLFPLIRVEGDWFRVLIPVGTGRVEAYVSRRVSILVKEEAAATPARGTPPLARPDRPSETRDGMSVALHADSETIWLTPAATKVIRVPETDDSIATLAALMPAAPPPLPSAGAMRVTYVWTVDGRSAARVVEHRRPTLAVLFKDIPGVNPDDVTPAIVRLPPTAWGARVVTAVRGRADQASRTGADWDVNREMRQDLVRAETTVAERGAVRLRPAVDLSPGEYAVVIRPNGRRRLSGASVLSTSGEGRIFNLVFEFAVK
jgi:hypothetical protein